MLALTQGFLVEEQWHSWKMDHGKVYADSSEENLRRQIWEDNLARIQAHNSQAQAVNFSLAINQFADLVSSNFCANDKISVS